MSFTIIFASILLIFACCAASLFVTLKVYKH
jgi:hypothetical protein